MIEVKTILNAQLMRKFGASQVRSKMWMALSVAGVLVAAGIVCLFVKSLGAVCGIPIIALGILVPVAYSVAGRAVWNGVIKRSEAVRQGNTQLFRFAADRVMLNESNKYTVAQDKQFSYDEIGKAVEREDAFCLYIGASAYVLDVKGFRMGARRDLHDLLLDKLGRKRFRFTSRIYAKK